MTKELLHKMQMSAYKMVAVQLAVVLIATLILACFASAHVTWSALYGGLVCALANALFAKRVFAKTGASQSRQIMKGFYFGEMQKIIVTALLFFIAIKYLNVVFLAFFLMYISAQISFWFAPVILQAGFFRKK